jgi:hypothetical protein
LYKGWLDLTDKDKVWSVAIREYCFQIKWCQATQQSVEHGDQMLWTLIQSGLAMLKAEQSVLSNSHLQVKRFAAVGMSCLLRKQESEKARVDECSRQLGELQKSPVASDQATTVSPA